MQGKYTSIDLFSGPGGLCTGFMWAGIKALVAVEWNSCTAHTYAASHDADVFELESYLDGTMEDPERHFAPSERTLLIHGDINKVETGLVQKILRERFGVESVDIVSGGAPCESFSMAGDRKERDERNALYRNVLRVARGVNAKLFLFENVKGLFSKKSGGRPGGMYRRICEEFQSRRKGMPSYALAGSDRETVLLKAADYGVPQMRERLFLVGMNRNLDLEYKYPEKTHGEGRPFGYVTVQDALMDLPQIGMGEESEEYGFDPGSLGEGKRKEFLKAMRGDGWQVPSHLAFGPHGLSSHKAPRHLRKMAARMKEIRPGESMATAYARLVGEGRKEFADSVFPRKIYGARNRRLVLGRPSFTVTSHCCDEMIHPVLDRGLTPREAARLQSFPDWYRFTGPYVSFHSAPEQNRYEQIGDAIPPLLAYALGKELAASLEGAGFGRNWKAEPEAASCAEVRP